MLSDCSLAVDSSPTDMPLLSALLVACHEILGFAPSSTRGASVGTTHSNTCQAKEYRLGLDDQIEYAYIPALASPFHGKTSVDRRGEHISETQRHVGWG